MACSVWFTFVDDMWCLEGTLLEHTFAHAWYKTRMFRSCLGRKTSHIFRPEREKERGPSEHGLQQHWELGTYTSWGFIRAVPTLVSLGINFVFCHRIMLVKFVGQVAKQKIKFGCPTLSIPIWRFVCQNKKMRVPKNRQGRSKRREDEEKQLKRGREN